MKEQDNKLAERLYKLRTSLGMKQSEMAEQFRVTYGAIAMWETGKRPITGPALRLLEIYENPVKELTKIHELIVKRASMLRK